MRRITKLGGYVVGIGAGAAALVWLIKDRLLGPESVPVEAADAPAFRVAPGPPSQPTADADDLSEVVGIGPVYRARLEQAGITSFTDLAQASPEDIAAAAQVAEDRATDWRDQAAGLASA
jgi:predicted flap endonuclease-1-like 5' DNA nuclease